MKRILLAALFAAATALPGAAKLPVFGYTFTAKTLGEEGKDPGFKKLADGKINADGKKERYGRVLFRHIDNRRAPVRITFNFKNEIKLTEVKAHYFRWHNSYGIKAIKLMGIKSDGSQIPMGSVTLNHPYKKPKTDPYNMVAVIKSEDSTPVKSVQVIFTATGGYLSLNEIEFFGTEIKKAPPKFSGNPLDKFAAQAKPGLRMYQADGQYILENDHVIYGIDPRYSGSVNYAYDKSGKCNLIMYSAPGSGYGPLFNDRFWPGGYDIRDMYRYISYIPTVISDTPEKKQIKMTGVGKSGIYANVKIEKIFTLEKNSSLLRVDFSITNGMDNVAPLKKGYWTYGGVQVQEGYRRIVPGLNGVEVSPAFKQLATRDISAGWYGVEAAGRGLAILVPWERLKEVYYWAENTYTGTVECKLGIYPITAGTTFSFTMSLAPFDKVGIPDKVNEFAAGGFNLEPEYPKTPATLSFKARLNTPGSCDVRISAGILRKGKVTFKQIAKGKISGTHGEIKFKPLGGRGTIVYRAELLQGGKVKFFADSSAAFNNYNSGLYAQVLPGEKIKDSSPETAKLNLNFNSTAIATPHIKWAKPYAGGKIKVLAINSVTGGIRDMIEMAQRFDIDLTTNYIAGLHSLSGHTMSLNIKSCVNELTKKLKKEYDLFVVSSNAWDIIGKGNAAAILEQVSRGAGLIMTEPVAFPSEFAKYLKLNPRRGVTNDAAVWNGDFKGIDSKLLPATRVRNYLAPNAKEGVKVAAFAKHAKGNTPLALSFNYGKGKVYALAYIASNPAGRRGLYNTKALFFLPQMSYGPADAIPQYDYHEYQMAWFGKLFFDAAGKKSCITDGKAAVRAGKLTLDLKASAAAQVEVAVTVRDKFSAPVQTLTVKKSLKQGANKFDITLAPLALSGLHIADVIVKNAKGSCWWGAASFENISAARITGVKIADKIYKKSEKLPVEVSFSGKARVRYSLFDTTGNEVARAEGAKVAIALADCRTPVANLVIELVSGKKVLDRSRHRIELYQAPAPHRLNIAQGWPGVGGKGQLYLLPTYLKQLRKFGITCTSGSRSSRDVPIVERAIRDSGITFLSAEINTKAGIGGKRPFDVTKKPKTKFDLIRKPCLSTPGAKEKLAQVSYISYHFKYGVMVLPGPDEANMFSEWDGCFSEHCQKAFRNWLKKVYPSLDALNKSWDCSFKSWDEVIALTASEVRQKKSFAGWLDHRTFNDWNRADSFRIMLKAMDKATGNIPYSLSGTSETNPWNAWDWYQLMPYLRTLASYSGEQTIQHRSFAPHRLSSMPWIGYDGDRDGQHQRILFNLMNGSTGFNIYGNYNIQTDYQISPRGKELIEVLNIYRNGPGEAIMRMDIKTYPIAFLYSPASIKVNWITGFANQQVASTGGFSQMVKDASLVYDYIAYGQLEKGGVPSKYKVVFLPMVSAISDKEAAALEAFVKRGGVLIADFRTGTFDDHGKPRMTPALNKLFGIRSKGEVKKEDSVIIGTGVLKGLKVNASHIETNITPAGAKVIGTANGKPVIFENSYGKGKAVYFGASVIVTFGDWKEMRYAKNNAPSTKALNDYINSFFKSRGIKPLATAPTLQGTTLAMRESGVATILATLRDISQTAQLSKETASHQINLDKKYHIYDLLKGAYIGYGNKFSYKYTPVTQGVFVLLPYKGKGIDVKFTSDGAVLTLVADTKKFADHTFHVELLNEKGEIVSAFNDVIPGKGNKGFYKFHKPFNAKGQWKLQVREVLTGLKKTVALP